MLHNPRFNADLVKSHRKTVWMYKIMLWHQCFDFLLRGYSVTHSSSSSFLIPILLQIGNDLGLPPSLSSFFLLFLPSLSLSSFLLFTLYPIHLSFTSLLEQEDSSTTRLLILQRVSEACTLPLSLLLVEVCSPLQLPLFFLFLFSKLHHFDALKMMLF